MKKLFIALTIILVGLFAVACNEAKEEKTPIKVAAALTGSKTDGGWNQSAYEGLLKMEKDLNAEVSYNENTQAADYERILRDYAKAGNDLVIGHGAQFSDAAKKVAEEFPDIFFIVTSTNVTNNKNLGSLNNNYWEAGFLKGAFAALISKTGTVGAVGGANISPIQNDIKGFEIGAKYVNANIKVLSAFTGSGDDSNKAKETALSFIAQGADVIEANANQAGKGVYAATQEKGVYSLASISDVEYKNYTDTLIAAATADMATALFNAAKQVQDGTYVAHYKLNSVADEIIDFTYNPALKSKVPADVTKKMDDIKAKMKTFEIDAQKLVTGNATTK